MDYTFLINLISIGFSAGLFGSMLGIGGGVFLVPLLILILSVPIHTAIGTSIVAVIATSVGGASVYIKTGLVNIRLGILLATATTIGAIAGGLTAVNLSPRPLTAIFGIILLYIAYSMYRRRQPPDVLPAEPSDPVESPLSVSYYDVSLKRPVQYNVRSLSIGLLAGVLAGNISGLTGTGGGAVNVPIMHLVMKIPMKPAVATSNFLIGVTAVASAFIYYSRGYVHPLLVAPTVIGIFLGAQVGPRLAYRIKSVVLKRVFTVLLFLMAIRMLLKAADITLIP